MKVGKRALSIFMSVILVLGLNPGVALAESTDAYSAGPLQSEDVATDDGTGVNVEVDERLGDAGSAQTQGARLTTLATEDPTIIATGRCGAQGDNVTWKLDSEGTLTISGEGEMADGTVAKNYVNRVNAVVVEPGVTSIGAKAFYAMASMVTIALPEGLKKIGDRAFYYCYELEMVTIPQSVAELGNALFYECKRLWKVVLPDSLEAIPPHLCFYCGLLREITLPSNVRTIGESAFAGSRNLVSVNFPEGLETIGASAFSACTSLALVNFPSTLKQIGGNAFDMAAFGSVRIPGGVTEIKGDAFARNYRLRSVVLEDGVETVGRLAFWNCSNLESVTIPASVKSIDGLAFNGCYNLATVDIAQDNAVYAMGKDALFSKDGELLVACLPGTKGLFEIPDGVRRLAPSCFDRCKFLTSISVPASLDGGNDQSLLVLGDEAEVLLNSYDVDPDNAFYSSLDGVLYNKDKTKLIGLPGRGEYGYCYTAPDGVKEIGEEAFRISREALNITLPLSLEKLDRASLVVRGDGSRLRYAGTREQWDAVLTQSGFTLSELTWNNDIRKDPVFNTFAYGAAKDYATGEYFHYSLNSSGVLTVGDSNEGSRCNMANYDKEEAPWSIYADTVKKIVFMEQILSVGDAAFAHFNKLERVDLPAGLHTVGQSAFIDCPMLTDVVCRGNPFEVEGADSATASFSTGVTLLYYSGLGSWQVDSAFDVAASTWMGYRMAPVALPEIAGIELERDVIEVNGIASGWNDASVGVIVRSSSGEDITSDVSVTVSHSADFSYGPIWTGFGYDPNYRQVYYDKNSNLIKVERSAYEDVYSVTARGDGVHVAAGDVSSGLSVKRKADVLVGVTTWGGNHITNSMGPGLRPKSRFSNQYAEDYAGPEQVTIKIGGLNITSRLKDYGIYVVGKTFYVSQQTPSGYYTLDLGHMGSGWDIVNQVIWHTATFKAGGKVVDTVKFAEGNASLNEPAVPERENYHGEWAAYDLSSAKGDITVEAVYTRIDTDAVSEIDAKADESDNGDGTKTIVLSASAATQMVRAEKTNAKPLDVVLVLDQSGSMADTLSSTDSRSKRDALVECANDFLGKLFDNAQNTGADHRVALAGFAYSAYNGGSYRNTGLLATAGGGAKGYASLTASDYANALLPISAGGVLNPAVTAGVNRVAAEGATAADLGLKMARNIFSSQGNAGERERVVVFITDGTPTCWGETPQLIERTAAAAISEAGYLKGSQGAKVYAVGVHESADPAADFNGTSSGIITDARGGFKSYDFNRFMHAVSSNYPSATSMASLGAGDKAAGYYLGVTDTGSLSNIFRDILYTTVYETKVFDRATLTCKLAKGVELEWAQERDICENLGLAAGDVTVTRNDDGTCDIAMRNVPVTFADDGTGALVYQAQLAFQVTFEGESAVAQVRATVSDRSELGGEASYSSAHEHSFVEVSRTGTCDTGVTAHYACSCGAEKDEIVVAAGTQHDYVAEITDDGGLAQSVERLVCSGCGHVIDKNINYQVAYSKGFRTAVLDLNLLENEVVVQPDGTIGMRFYVGESGARSYVVTRISEDGKRTVYQTRLVDGWLVFDADHFSVYAVAEADEDGNPVAGDISYEAAQLALAGEEEDEDANIASGTWGTCPWEISADGTLTVHPGEGADRTDPSSPWKSYMDVIEKVVFAEEEGARVVAPSDCSFLLALGTYDDRASKWNTKVKSIDLSGLDTSQTTTMSHMFYGCKSLTSLNLSPLDTSEVRSTNYMFEECGSLESLDLSPFATSSVMYMDGMFSHCSSLTALDLSPFDKSYIISMSGLFDHCSSLVDLNVSSIDTSHVENMGWMFFHCSSLTSLDLSSLDTSSVTNMNYMFLGCSSLGKVLVSRSWSMNAVEGSADMFSGCCSLVGGNGTAYDDDYIDGEYARIDAVGTPGYLTGDASTTKPDSGAGDETDSGNADTDGADAGSSTDSGSKTDGESGGSSAGNGASTDTPPADGGAETGGGSSSGSGSTGDSGSAGGTSKSEGDASSAANGGSTTDGKLGEPSVDNGTSAGSPLTDGGPGTGDGSSAGSGPSSDSAPAVDSGSISDTKSEGGSEGASDAVERVEPLKVSGKTVKVAFGKKKAVKVKASAAYNFKKTAVGKVTYKRIAKGSSKWLPKVNAKTGAITVKKGAPKKTHKVRIRITAAGDAYHETVSKIVTVKVKVG